MIIDMLVNIGYKKNNSLDCRAEALIESMDRNGIDRSVAICQSEYIDNEYIYQSVKRYPDRLIGIGMVNPWDPQAETELEKCFSEYGFRGVKLNCLRMGLAADRHSLLDPLYRIIQKNRGFIIGHCMSDLFSIPNKWEEMAQRFPDVPVLISHIGAPNMSRSAIDCCLRTPNLYVVTAGAFPYHIREAYERLGAERLLFASDSLYGSPWQELMTIDQLINSEEDRRKIKGINAQEILKL